LVYKVSCNRRLARDGTDDVDSLRFGASVRCAPVAFPPSCSYYGTVRDSSRVPSKRIFLRSFFLLLVLIRISIFPPLEDRGVVTSTESVVIYYICRIGSTILRGSTVPTTQLGRKGVNKK